MKMIYSIFPYVIKHHGSTKYFKLITSALRQKSSKGKFETNTKVFASAPGVPLAKFPREDSRVNDIIGKNVTDSSNGDEIQDHCKSVEKPDVTLSVSEKLDASKNDDKVKLLNTIKPSFLEWHRQHTDWRLFPSHYKSLAKFRLSGLVVLTTLAGYGMAPGPFDPMTLSCMVIGTGLTSAAANAVNQVLEIPYDSQMNRTKNRVLTRGFLSPFHAAVFATCCASLGATMLFLGTNTLTAVLGLTNLILYTSFYTPMKRCSIVNTWLGSVVGAIPPLMGWAACMGTLNMGAFLMGAILYSWQFPHFNALSWNLRSDYSRAGYRMTSVVDPSLCRSAALRHSIALLIFCSAAPLLDLTTWTFAFDSFPLNCYFIYCAWKFYKDGDTKSARKLFRLSLVYLPALMFLMFIGKKYTPPVT
ncbi:protoheme IX farnesyltransferase, mitochondrial [Parasteatoda tepidariorum]|uniref:protoheme IX farnesyltransferase, mitochondrial n=1 Tax=Parasteatoda tepidariorum TaxID=114398 RepID=UPI00077FC40F|nr:protoheme IX farnesyltransferase, mitochondrial [Parasteatoda tepidariorum]XP_015924356.1 protoheme IX farnesyltransferase, mitochondrial [Parasteatoda tepidariorum]XP_015924357.1 protoheme IX farnesyltransferase, mitochondrial [Parasteatoda tepidariorum]